MPGEIQVGREEILLQERGQVQERAAQGGGGLIVPENGDVALTDMVNGHGGSGLELDFRLG